MEIRMVTPGGSVSYNIPVMKAQRYSIGEIFEKGLLFPFHIFSHEGRFEDYERDAEKLGQLEQEYGRIRNHLEKQLEQGKIDEYTKCTVIDMSKKVLEHIAKKFQAVKEGVSAAMGGKILEYEAKTIKDDAIAGQLIQRYQLAVEEAKGFMQ